MERWLSLSLGHGLGEPGSIRSSYKNFVSCNTLIGFESWH